MINHIKEYTERGWVVHPLSSPKDSGGSPGKKPLLAGWQHLKKTPGLYNFPPGCNIGLVCGKVSGVMVIDYDNLYFIADMINDLRNENFWETWMKTMVSKRTFERGHIFYKYDPEIKSQKHHLLGIEVLSDGSNAVIPPSIHKSGDVYKWIGAATQAIEMPDDVKERLLSLFRTETELKQIMSKCRTCFKKVLTDYPANIPDVHGADGRLFMLAICTDLVALGAKEAHLKMFSKLVYREKYSYEKTLVGFEGIAPGKTWRCETLREKLPAYVNCSECVNHKFSTTEHEQAGRMRMTIPASVKELTLVIEK